MRMLPGRRRVNDRRQSLRSTLDRSYALPDEPGQAALHRISAFAARVRSLLVATAGAGGTR
jgi:predicted ATPase